MDALGSRVEGSRRVAPSRTFETVYGCSLQTPLLALDSFSSQEPHTVSHECDDVRLRKHDARYPRQSSSRYIARPAIDYECATMDFRDPSNQKDVRLKWILLVLTIQTIIKNEGSRFRY